MTDDTTANTPPVDEQPAAAEPQPDAAFDPSTLKLEKIEVGEINSLEDLAKLLDIRERVVEMMDFLRGELRAIDYAGTAFIENYACGECSGCKAEAAAKEAGHPVAGPSWAVGSDGVTTVTLGELIEGLFGRQR